VLRGFRIGKVSESDSIENLTAALEAYAERGDAPAKKKAEMEWEAGL
jgi:hypothetical protein